MYTAEIQVFCMHIFQLRNITRQVNYIIILYYTNWDGSFNEVQLTI